MRVAVCDDHAVFRRGMVEILAAEPDLEVVELDGLERAGHETWAARPEVLVVAPGEDQAGSEVIRRAVAAGVAVLAVGDPSSARLEGWIVAGASGVVGREVEPASLADAVRQVGEGRGVLDPPLVPVLLEAHRRLVAGLGADPGPRLTRREREVLAALVRGRSNRAIAEELFISENTVKNHVRNLYDKLGVHSRAEASWWARQQGAGDDHA